VAEVEAVEEAEVEAVRVLAGNPHRGI